MLHISPLPCGERAKIAGRWFFIIAVAGTVIAPWMIRNHNISGEWKVAGRGGEVLSIRAEYDTMPWSDYFVSYFYFTPLIGDRLLLKTFGQETFDRFDRDNDESYYRRAKREKGVAHTLAEEKDISLTKASLLVIKDNFVKHMALTAAFAYRGAFMQAFIRRQPLPVILVAFTAAVSLLFVPAGLIATGWAFFTNRLRYWVFLFPAYFSYGFHAFLTHYIPRYSMPLIPVFLVTLLVLVYWLVERRKNAE